MDRINLMDTIRRIRHAAEQGPHEQRPYLNGVLWHVTDSLEMTAADGYILARETLSIDEPFDRPWCGVLPLGSMRTLITLLEESEVVSLMRVSDNSIAVATNIARMVIPRMTDKPVRDMYNKMFEKVAPYTLSDALSADEIWRLPRAGDYLNGGLVEVAGIMVQRDLINKLITSMSGSTKFVIRTSTPPDPISIEAVQLPWRAILMPVSLAAARGQEAS